MTGGIFKFWPSIRCVPSSIALVSTPYCLNCVSRKDAIRKTSSRWTGSPDTLVLISAGFYLCQVIWWIVPGDFYRVSETLDESVFVNINEVEKVCGCSHDETRKSRTLIAVLPFKLFPRLHDFSTSKYTFPCYRLGITYWYRKFAELDGQSTVVGIPCSSTSSFSPSPEPSRVFASRLTQSRTCSRVLESTLPCLSMQPLI